MHRVLLRASTVDILCCIAEITVNIELLEKHIFSSCRQKSKPSKKPEGEGQKQSSEAIFFQNVFVSILHDITNQMELNTT
jgi:hypothetical protein